MTTDTMSTHAPYAPHPARLTARLDPGLSRWLWLVKWLLALPHHIVLALLWVACTLVGVVAFFAILFTGRYPRPLFDFTAGVLRWDWRVSYYAYAALGTDRYPPFSLADSPDYPARWDVAYPERLSRGLVLVKWWLLAIPHYLVLGLVGGGIRALIGLLSLYAGIALAVTGRYPPGIFDLVVGLNRWVLRVFAYVALLTDEYPPFRLDQGGSEPAAATPR
ncbi:DUF4389 domain-containing protein [Streptomyces sp. YU58]|uniref:DUF4389 domain-containing protein n=1 Tax=Streptomyces sp. SX92 TaxID=3158972 RepID=UPI0027BA6A24|nr:DUF4389 domain-containing protein [Streptomyces coralus]WLW57087.1 DUF4389 domain-containing protein [Streptomyces coralus]